MKSLGAALSTNISWTLPEQLSLQPFCLFYSCIPQENLEYSKLSNVKGVSCSGIGIIISFLCLTTSPAVKLQDKYLTMLNSGKVQC